MFHLSTPLITMNNYDLFNHKCSKKPYRMYCAKKKNSYEFIESNEVQVDEGMDRVRARNKWWWVEWSRDLKWYLLIAGVKGEERFSHAHMFQRYLLHGTFISTYYATRAYRFFTRNVTILLVIVIGYSTRAWNIYFD